MIQDLGKLLSRTIVEMDAPFALVGGRRRGRREEGEGGRGRRRYRRRSATCEKQRRVPERHGAMLLALSRCPLRSHASVPVAS